MVKQLADQRHHQFVIIPLVGVRTLAATELCSPATYPIGRSVLLIASWLTMYTTTSISLLVSIPRFVVGGDGAGRGRGLVRWLRVELFTSRASHREISPAHPSWLTMYLTTSISLLVSIPRFVVGGDGAGRGRGLVRWLRGELSCSATMPQGIRLCCY